MREFDALVVGGGPAGSAAAILLARQGRKVCLFEKEKSAHHKVCGEFISHEALPYLEKLGINPVSLGAVEIRNWRIFRKQTILEGTLPFTGYSLSRRSLDEALLQRAANIAVVRRGTAVARIENNRAFTADGTTFSAPQLYLATGKHDLRGLKRRMPGNDNMIGFKMHYRLNAHHAKALAGHTELYLFNGGYAGLEPVENGLANLCLVIRKENFAGLGKSWPRFMDYLQKNSEYLGLRLQGAQSCWPKPLAVYGIPYGFIFKGQEMPGLFRLGDQMAVIPSFTGEGISIALHTAFLAAETGEPDRYHAEARRQLSAQISRAQRLSRLISRPALQKTFISTCEFMPSLPAILAMKTRISEPFLRN